MSKQNAPTLPLYAFIVADVAFLVAAWWIGTRSPHPLDLGHVFAVLVSLAGGALCGVLPFMRQYQAQLDLNETDKLTNTVSQIRELAKVGRTVREAADQWHLAQEASSETVKAAKGVFDKMAEETKSFHEFLENAHKTEINNLRLQVEKLRKTDQEWMQITVNMLDHVFALYEAGQKSEHVGVANQLAQFRAACYDIVRRNGLIPFEAEPGEPFDSRKYQLKDPSHQPGPDKLVQRTLATGYTFQGQLLRKALVGLAETEIEGKPSRNLDSVGSDEVKESLETSNSQSIEPQEEVFVEELQSAAEELESSVEDEADSEVSESEMTEIFEEYERPEPKKEDGEPLPKAKDQNPPPPSSSEQELF